MALRVTRSRRHYRGDVRPGQTESAAKAGARANQRAPVITREQARLAGTVPTHVGTGGVSKTPPPEQVKPRVGGLTDREYLRFKNAKKGGRHA